MKWCVNPEKWDDRISAVDFPGMDKLSSKSFTFSKWNAPDKHIHPLYYGGSWITRALPEGAKKSEMKWEEEEEKNNETELLCLIKNYTRSWVAYSLA